jgi:shikimate 5-dehydrogenase
MNPGKRFGLIGHPVAGSFSPRLFEAAYGGRYAYDLIEGADFGASWQRFLDAYDGINITAPFKQDAFRAVDALSDDARLCGAVNLAVKTPSGIVGYNTDVDGVILAVHEACPSLQPVIPGLTGNLPAAAKPSGALIIGCGGAGRAAAVAALRLGCRVTLANRTPARAAALADELGCDWIPVDDLPALSPDLVIYTVPGPMEGITPMPLQGLPNTVFPKAVILEANYRTPCLQGCGRAYISGLRWLLYQAVAGYEIFTGETPDADAMFRIFC